MLQITINIIDCSNYITCTIIIIIVIIDYYYIIMTVLIWTSVKFHQCRATVHNYKWSIALSFTKSFLFVFYKINFFYPEKIRSRTNITPKSLLAPCQASTRRPQLKSGDFLTEILYSASSPTVSCKNFIRLYFKITSRFSPNAPKFIRPWVLLGYRDLCFTWSTLCWKQQKICKAR